MLQSSQMWLERYTLGCPPSQDSSHHQDYYICRIGDPYKPSFPLLLGRGTTQGIYTVYFFLPALVCSGAIFFVFFPQVFSMLKQEKNMWGFLHWDSGGVRSSWFFVGVQLHAKLGVTNEISFSPRFFPVKTISPFLRGVKFESKSWWFESKSWESNSTLQHFRTWKFGKLILRIFFLGA